MCQNCSQCTSILWGMHATSQWMRQQLRDEPLMLQCKMFSRRICVISHPSDVKRRYQHSEIRNKLQMNLLNRNTSQFIILTSLMCTLFWLTWVNSCAVEHSWFIFLEVMRHHVSGEVVDLIPSFSAVHRSLGQWKNYYIIGSYLRELWGIICVPGFLRHSVGIHKWLVYQLISDFYS